MNSVLPDTTFCADFPYPGITNVNSRADGMPAYDPLCEISITDSEAELRPQK